MKRYSPTQKQRDAYPALVDPSSTYVLFEGGAGAGKTFMIAGRYMTNRALQFPGLPQLACRHELRAARQSVWSSIKKYLHDYVPQKEWRVYEGDLEIHFANGSFIRVDGLDKKERREKILGQEWGTIFINQVEQCQYEALNILKTRARVSVPHFRTPNVRSAVKVIMDCNPKHRKHWVNVLCNQGLDPITERPVAASEQWRVVHWTPYDNLDNLPNNYVQILSGLPKVLRERMLNGIWADNSGAVYEEFDEDVHVVDEFDIPSNWRIYRGIDFGYRAPFCCLWIAIDLDDRMWVFDEHFAPGLTIDQHMPYITSKTGGRAVMETVCDWEAEPRARLEELGIDCTQADKSIQLGILRVHNRLKIRADGRPGMYIFRRCKSLITEMYDYHYPEGVKASTGVPSEDPIDSHNHALDPLRYVISHVDGCGTSLEAYDLLGQHDGNITGVTNGVHGYRENDPSRGWGYYR